MGTLTGREASLLNRWIEHIDGFVSAKMSISALKSLMVVFDVLLISSVKFECCHWSGSGGGMRELNANPNSSLWSGGACSLQTPGCMSCASADTEHPACTSPPPRNLQKRRKNDCALILKGLMQACWFKKKGKGKDHGKVEPWLCFFLISLTQI